jgi:Ca-activated chloride channel homolog
MNRRVFACTALALLLLAALVLPALAQSNRVRRPAAPPPDAEPQKAEPARPAPPKAEPPPRAEKATPEEAAAAAAAGEEGTIKVETSLVTIPASVMDRDGRFAPNLTKRDFQIYEDGVEQEVEGFAAVEAPFHVVLLLDTSRSTLFRLEDIQQAAVTFVEQLRSQDKVMIVSFDDKIWIDSEFTSDRARLRRAIYGTRTGGSTKLYDAVDLVITERLNKVEGRKAIVLFTDGVDTTSRLASARSTLERVEESSTLVYPIQYDTEGDMGPSIFGGGGGRGGPPIINPWPFPRGGGGGGGRRWPLISYQFPGGRGSGPGDYSRATSYLREMALRSGGRHQQADTINNLYDAFASIAEELRHQYALSYYPTNAARDGSFRRVRVRVRQEGLVVRARDGYRAESEAAAQNGAAGKSRDERPALKRSKQFSGVN